MMKTCIIMNAPSIMCLILWLSIVESKKDGSSYLDLIKKRVQMVKERVRREKTTAIDLRRNAQTSTSNSTSISASPVVSGNSTSSSKNPFGNPDPFNGPWPECLGWDGTDCSNYIKLLAPDVSNLQTIQPYYDDDTTTGTATSASGGNSTITRVKRHRRKKDIHRVYIIVDEYGVVSMNPHRA